MIEAERVVVNVLFDDRFGGPPKRVVEVARLLRRDGWRTVLAIPRGTGGVEAYASAGGVSVRRVGMCRMPRPGSIARFLGWAVLQPRDVLRFARLYRAESADLVHVSGAFFLAPAVAAKARSLPLVWHLNDTLVPRPAARLLGSLVQWLADVVVVEADAVARHYGIRSWKARKIHAPVDVERFAGSRRSRPRVDPFRVGLVANWTAIKGLELFVEAGARVRREVGDALRLVFAGSKLANHEPYSRRIEDLIDELGLRPFVIDHGFVSTIEDVFADLDVLVLSSIAEACPQVVLEGMASGLPVVAADVGGVAEILLGEPGCPAGIVVSGGDPDALAGGILAVFRSPSLALELGRCGRTRAEERFSLAICARRHAQAYSAAVIGDAVRSEPGGAPEIQMCPDATDRAHGAASRNGLQRHSRHESAAIGTRRG